MVRMTGVETQSFRSLETAVSLCGDAASDRRMVSDLRRTVYPPLATMLGRMNPENRSTSVEFLTNLYDIYARADFVDNQVTIGNRRNLNAIVAREISGYNEAEAHLRSQGMQTTTSVMDLVVRLQSLYAANQTGKIGEELGRRMEFKLP